MITIFIFLALFIYASAGFALRSANIVRRTTKAVRRTRAHYSARAPEAPYSHRAGEANGAVVAIGDSTKGGSCVAPERMRGAGGGGATASPRGGDCILGHIKSSRCIFRHRQSSRRGGGRSIVYCGGHVKFRVWVKPAG